MAAAHKAGVDYLVTLDKRHLLNKKAKIEPHVGFVIVRPGDILDLLRTSESCLNASAGNT